jgi:REP element-mobilizing transposase RayT
MVLQEKQLELWFKSMVTNEYIRGIKQKGWVPLHGKLWQCNYYEHIIRSEKELYQIGEYIINNPIQWALDEENPDRVVLRRGTACRAH